MRFHLLGLAHVPTRPDIPQCAFSQKVVKLGAMLKGLGHEVFFYGTEYSQVDCTEFIQCSSEKVRHGVYGNYDWSRHFFRYHQDDFAHQVFNANAVLEINRRKQDGDFLLCSFGVMHKPIADMVQIPLTVESGIGYEAVFAPYKIWESYGWMNHIYGQRGIKDGSVWDAVIPNCWNPDEFAVSEQKGDYYLYVGRLITRKGIRVACEVTSHMGKKLVVAGQGDPTNIDGLDLRQFPNVEYIGTVQPAERSKLMGKAIATFVPTSYIAPFEGVHIESMFCGTPVLTTDWGCFPETNVHGFTGYRCRSFTDFVRGAENVHRLSARLIRNYAVENFSMEVIGGLYQHYFQRITNMSKFGWYYPSQPETERDWFDVKNPLHSE